MKELSIVRLNGNCFCRWNYYILDRLDKLLSLRYELALIKWSKLLCKNNGALQSIEKAFKKWFQGSASAASYSDYGPSIKSLLVPLKLDTQIWDTI